MKKLRNPAFLAVFALLFTIVCSTDSFAQGQVEDAVGFSVKAVQSDKQTNKKASYFDLLLEPGEEHVLEVDVFNNSNSELKVFISACTAGTNSGGVIDYDKANVTDPSLETAFEEIATVDNSLVTIPPASSHRAKITVEMPQKKFDGIMLGGIVIKKIEDQSPEASGTIVQNEYCYILGAKIMVGDVEVQPDFRINSASPKLSNHHTSIAVNIQNFMAAIAKGVSIDAAVYFNEEKEPLFTSSTSSFDIAPNSNFDYIIPCDGRLSPGYYSLQLNLNLEDKNWTFQEDFTISNTEAENINSQAVNIEKVDYYKIATICLGVILVLIVIYVIWKKMRDDKNRENRRNNEPQSEKY